MSWDDIRCDQYCPICELCLSNRHPCKSLSTEKHETAFRALESALLSDQELPLRTFAFRRLVPTLSRTGHPFTASRSLEPSQKIEFVFSAVPKQSEESLGSRLRRPASNVRDPILAPLLTEFLTLPAYERVLKDEKLAAA